MRAPAWLPLAFLIVLSSCGAASAWDPFATTPEPLELPDDVDSRDPQAVYRYGLGLLERSPGRAADAFYWASRLDPAWGTPLYARRIAILMSEPRTFDAYMKNRPAVVQSPGMQRLDSLYLRALTMNPFPLRKEDGPALRSLILHQVRTRLRRTMGGAAMPSDVQLRILIDDYLAREEDPTLRALLAYSDGRFHEAEQYYREAVEDDPESPSLASDLGRALFMVGRYPEAVAEMERAMALLDGRDADELVRVYESKALYAHSVGMISESLGNQAAARDAYALALQEDLSYYPAHIRLAELALADADTVTAFSEMALAVDIHPDDASVRYRHGLLLFNAGQWRRAEEEFRAAIALEPLFAPPYRALALALERQERMEEAVAQHEAFIERSAPSARGVRESRDRLQRVGSGGQR